MMEIPKPRKIVLILWRGPGSFYPHCSYSPGLNYLYKAETVYVCKGLFRAVTLYEWYLMLLYTCVISDSGNIV